MPKIDGALLIPLNRGDRCTTFDLLKLGRSGVADVIRHLVRARQLFDLGGELEDLASYGAGWDSIWTVVDAIGAVPLLACLQSLVFEQHPPREIDAFLSHLVGKGPVGHCLRLLCLPLFLGESTVTVLVALVDERPCRVDRLQRVAAFGDHVVVLIPSASPILSRVDVASLTCK
jgi:hypothetical protein